MNTQLVNVLVNIINSLTQEEKHLLDMQLKKSSKSEQVQPLRMENEPFVGMWQDREEMNDTNEWIRQLRHSEWSNEYKFINSPKQPTLTIYHLENGEYQLNQKVFLI